MNKSVMQATTVIGTSHKKNNKPVQDFSTCMRIDKYIVLFTADGLGSSRHSDVAAKELVRHSQEFVIEFNYNTCTISDDVLPALLNVCFHNTNQWYQSKYNKDLNDYLSTLDIAVLNTKSGRLFYAHSGDGGIITRDLYGEYHCITKEQKPQYMPANYVYPFHKSDYWEFGQSENVSAVMIITDGLLDVFKHEFLKYGDNEVYTFLCASILESAITPKSFNAYSKYIKRILAERRITDTVTKKYETVFSNVHEEHMANTMLESVTDDVTIASAILIDMSQTPPLTDKAYYLEPDWKKLKEKREQDILSKLNNVNKGAD